MRKRGVFSGKREKRRDLAYTGKSEGKENLLSGKEAKHFSKRAKGKQSRLCQKLWERHEHSCFLQAGLRRKNQLPLVVKEKKVSRRKGKEEALVLVGEREKISKKGGEKGCYTNQHDRLREREWGKSFAGRKGGGGSVASIQI